MYKVTISTLFIDGKKHVRGDMVDITAEQAATLGTSVSPSESPTPKAKPKANASTRKKKAAKTTGHTHVP